MENRNQELSTESTESLVSQGHGSLVGRELDAAVAERVFGIKKVFLPSAYKSSDDVWGATDSPHYIPSGKSPRTHMIDAKEVPYFSTDIAAAMQVVERLQNVNVELALLASEKRWRVTIREFQSVRSCPKCPPVQPINVIYYSQSLPEAICRAALNAVKAKE